METKDGIGWLLESADSIFNDIEQNGMKKDK